MKRSTRTNRNRALRLALLAVCVSAAIAILAGLSAAEEQHPSFAVPASDGRAVFVVPHQQAVFEAPHQQSVFETPHQQAVFQAPEMQTVFEVPEQQSVWMMEGEPVDDQVDHESVHLTITGPHRHGDQLFAVGDGIWILSGKHDAALATRTGVGKIEVVGSRGTTQVSYAGIDEEDILVFLAGGPEPQLPCQSGEQNCECRVPAADACSGIEITTSRCCDSTAFCGCHSMTSPQDCIQGVRAVCYSPSN